MIMIKLFVDDFTQKVIFFIKESAHIQIQIFFYFAKKIIISTIFINFVFHFFIEYFTHSTRLANVFAIALAMVYKKIFNVQNNIQQKQKQIFSFFEKSNLRMKFNFIVNKAILACHF